MLALCVKLLYFMCIVVIVLCVECLCVVLFVVCCLRLRLLGSRLRETAGVATMQSTTLYEYVCFLKKRTMKTRRRTRIGDFLLYVFIIVV